VAHAVLDPNVLITRGDYYERPVALTPRGFLDWLSGAPGR
jgi:hypothetical protein